MNRLKNFKSVVALEVLLFVCKKPGIFVRELIDAIGSSSTTIIDAIEHLIRLNLIEEKRKGTFPRTRNLYPTEKGRRIGELLEKIDEILGE